MTDKKVFFYSLEIQQMPLKVLVGTSCNLQPAVLYFSTQEKLERWKRKNPESATNAIWGMHEISVKCCRELIKLSKKRQKVHCEECGR